MRKDLGIPWAVKRELEIRARRPASYRGFEYAGPGTPAIWMTVPMVLVAGVGSYLEAFGFMLAMAPYAVYLVIGAAGMVAGSLNVDRRVAGRLPVSAASHLIGKLVGSLLTLWGEILVLTPLLLIGSVKATASTWHGVLLVPLLTWLVLLGGLLGAALCNPFVSAGDAGRQARTNTWLLLFGYPCILGMLLAFWVTFLPITDPLGSVGYAAEVALRDGAALAALFVHPVGALSLLGLENHLADVARGVSVAILVAAVLFVMALRKVRSAFA